MTLRPQSRLLRHRQKSSEQGFSLMEVLVSILMVTITLTAMTPPLLLGMSSRIQSRRTEQAMNLAQEELEKVRLLVEKGEYSNSQLPPVASVSGIDYIAQADAPTKICSTVPNCRAYHAVETEDGYFVQTFRTEGETLEGQTQIVAFRMGVRVYSPSSKEELIIKGLEKDTLILTLDRQEGIRRKHPLAVLYADFTKGDLREGSLGVYREFLE